MKGCYECTTPSAPANPFISKCKRRTVMFCTQTYSVSDKDRNKECSVNPSSARHHDNQLKSKNTYIGIET